MKTLLSILAALAVAGSALAGQAVVLRPEPVDADGVVTLGDLFEGAGPKAAIAVASKPGATVVLDAGAVQAAARRAGLDWPNAEGYRRIIVRGGGAAAGPSRGNVEVLTYARSLNAGEMVAPEDLVWAKVAAAPADAISDAQAVTGMAARRPLRAGATALSRDLSAAQVIKAGDLVAVTYQAGGVSLSLQGRATANAAVGDTFAVQNPASKKMIQAVAIGPGQALIGPAGDRVLAARQTRYAFR